MQTSPLANPTQNVTARFIALRTGNDSTDTVVLREASNISSHYYWAAKSPRHSVECSVSPEKRKVFNTKGPTKTRWTQGMLSRERGQARSAGESLPQQNHILSLPP